MLVFKAVESLVKKKKTPSEPTPAQERSQAADPESGLDAANGGDEQKESSGVEESRLGAIEVHPHPDMRPKVYELAETRAVSHKYVFQRPRALQYAYHGQIITAGEEEEAFAVSQSLSRHSSSSSRGMLPIKEHHFLGIEKLRERLDLFIDLVWVGIITNLSEVFSSYYFDPESRSGEATLIFVIAFVASWRIWNMLREFLNNYYMDDIIQRIFIFWILTLSMFYGNNLAYLTEDLEDVKEILITTYLLIRGSFFMIELMYSIFIPWLRRLILLQFLLLLPTVGLWVGGIYVRHVAAVGPIVAALVWEYVVPIILDSPLADSMTPGDYRRAIDPNHFTSRFASFLIIIVGEGVLQLIARGPLGIGITGSTGVSVWGLTLYFILAFLYFNRDMSKTVVPAVRRRGWRVIAWVCCHVPMFASILTLSAGIMFLIRNVSQFAYNQTEEAEKIPEEDIPYFQKSAIWLIAASLAIILFSMTVMALLDRPLDPPKTLSINNRYARLSARAIYIVIVMCVPITKNLDPILFLGIASVGLQLVASWEWYASLETGGTGLLEPKSLAVMVAQDKQKHVRKDPHATPSAGSVAAHSSSRETR